MNLPWGLKILNFVYKDPFISAFVDKFWKLICFQCLAIFAWGYKWALSTSFDKFSLVRIIFLWFVDHRCFSVNRGPFFTRTWPSDPSSRPLGKNIKFISEKNNPIGRNQDKIIRGTLEFVFLQFLGKFLLLKADGLPTTWVLSVPFPF